VESVSTPYDQIAGQFGSARQRLQPKEVEYLALLVQPLAANSLILDLGCGAGHPIASHLAALGHRLIGVDGSASMLALARERLPDHRWIHDRIEWVEIDEICDAVVCWDSLFHLPRSLWPGVIANVHRWLRPGGRFMVSSGGVVEPGGEGFTDTMFGYEFFYDSLPPESMLALLDDVGFDIVVAEMCDLPDDGRNKGKWATVASRLANAMERL
jgi:SAM-dependent methyltransferase